MARRRSPDGLAADAADGLGFESGIDIFNGGDGGGSFQSADGDLNNALRGIFANDPGAAPGNGGFGGTTERPRDIYPDSGGPRAPVYVEQPNGAARAPDMGGNTDRPRDVFAGEQPRSPFDPGPEPGSGIDLSMLPQGVEAPPQQSVEAAPQSTAQAPFTPSPVSAQGMPPASPGMVAPSTPARQPFASPSAIFSAQGPRSVGGRGAGLTGGGLSMPGGPSGAPKPTEEMLQLLRSLGVGGGG